MSSLTKQERSRNNLPIVEAFTSIITWGYIFWGFIHKVRQELNVCLLAQNAHDVLLMTSWLADG